MGFIPLTNATSVGRSGSTVGWSGTGIPYTSGTYVPGDKSAYLRLQLQPTAPLSLLPATLNLSVTWNFAPLDTGTFLISDYAALGNASGPMGPNAAHGDPIGGTQAFGLDVPSGFTVADLNAGSIYLYLGLSTNPSTPITGTVTVSPRRGYTTVSPASQHPSLSSSDPYTIDVASSSPYVMLSITASSSALGDPFSQWTGTASLNNGQGATDSGALLQTVPASTPPPPSSRTASSTRKLRVNLSGGVASLALTATESASLNATTSTDCSLTISSSVTASIVTPDGTTATISIISIGYPDPPRPWPGGGVLAGRTRGSLGAGDELVRYLDDKVTVYAQFSQPSTGAAYDPSDVPQYRVYEENADIPILTGTLAAIDDANTVGWYGARFDASAANGFEVGKTYSVRGSGTVDFSPLAGGLCGGTFVLHSRPADGATFARAVWSGDDPGDSAGRAAGLAGMLRQVWSYCVNRNQLEPGTQTLYRDDSSAAMMQGMSDQAAERGRMI